MSAHREHARGYRRVFWRGMGISVGLHALVILFVLRLLHIGASGYTPLAPVVRPPQGLEVVRLRELPAQRAAEAVVEETPPERTPPPPRRPEQIGIPVPAEGAEEGPGLTNAERLQPREGDPRLWKDFGDRPLPEYLADALAQAEGAIRSRLGQMLDSLSLSEEQRRRATEWLTGEEDHEWGITPDGIVIDGTLIPLDLGQLFAEEGPRGREARAAARDLMEIRGADARMDAEQVQRERTEAMRERSRAEVARRDSVAAADSSDQATGSSRP